MSNLAPPVSQTVFNAVNRDVAHFVRKKLSGMGIEAVDVELHNSTLTKTMRVYVTLDVPADLKILFFAEQFVTQEIESEFKIRPHVFYWCFRPKEDVAISS